MIVEYRYFLRDGKPYKETTNKVDEDTTSSVSNPYDEITDTLISEGEYDTAVAAAIAAFDAEIIAIRQAQTDLLDDNAALKASIKTKLMAGTPLTSDEADAILSGF